MLHRLWVPGPFPGLNEIIDARMVVSDKTNAKGKRWNAYSDFKKKWGGIVSTYAQAQRLPTIAGGYFRYIIREPDKRRDPSNVIAGAVKLIEDGLQECGKLGNDGWKQIWGVETYLLVAEGNFPPGVTVTIDDEISSVTLQVRVMLARQHEGHDDEQVNRFRAGGKRHPANRAPARAAPLPGGASARVQSRFGRLE